MPGRHIKAHMDKVVDTRLATTLGDQELRVSTTEHLMAALQGFGVDNADIELDAGEVPIMDGSAEPFFGLMKKTGKKKQDGLRKVLRITKPITCRDGDKTVTISPCNGFKTGHTQHLAFMQLLADSPDCWELIEMKRNGAYSVLARLVSGTMAAGDIIFPFFHRKTTAAAA